MPNPARPIKNSAMIDGSGIDGAVNPSIDTEVRANLAVSSKLPFPNDMKLRFPEK
jgi:hypothetical protein